METTLNSDSLSAALVQYLQQKKQLTLRQIGELIGVSESFVSRVARGHRNFTLPHLILLEKALGRSLPVLLLESRRPANLSSEQEKLFTGALDLLQGLAAARAEIEPRDEKDPEIASGAIADLQQVTASVERSLIEAALSRASGNQAKAAQFLGIPRLTLRDKMAKYGLGATSGTPRTETA